MSEWNSAFSQCVLFILGGMFLITVEGVICRGYVIWKIELFVLLTEIFSSGWWCPPVSALKFIWWISLPGTSRLCWGVLWMEVLPNSSSTGDNTASVQPQNAPGHTLSPLTQYNPGPQIIMMLQGDGGKPLLTPHVFLVFQYIRCRSYLGVQDKRCLYLLIPRQDLAASWKNERENSAVAHTKAKFMQDSIIWRFANLWHLSLCIP